MSQILIGGVPIELLLFFLFSIFVFGVLCLLALLDELEIVVAVISEDFNGQVMR